MHIAVIDTLIQRKIIKQKNESGYDNKNVKAKVIERKTSQIKNISLRATTIYEEHLANEVYVNKNGLIT